MKKYGKCLATTCCDLNEISYENDYAILHVRGSDQIDIALVKIDLNAVDYVKHIHFSFDTINPSVLLYNQWICFT